MPDISEKILPQIASHQLKGISLGGEVIYPDYQGGSILNLPSSICKLFNIPLLGKHPLRETYLNPIQEESRTVITILMDALSLQRFRKWAEDGTAPVWRPLIEKGILAPITSITPSTTAAALTSIWTGQSASSHGIVGYESWLKEYGVVANMILHAPITYQGDNGGLRRAGFDVDTFLKGTRLGTHLEKYGIKSYAFLSRHIANSGLSRMHLKDTRVEKFSTPAELWVNVRHLVEKRTFARRFIWIYWGEVDHYGHRYGPTDERVSAEFASFSSAFENNFLKPIEEQSIKDTTLILTADHGMKFTPLNPWRDIKQHAPLDRCLHILTGENRIMYLYIKPGCVSTVKQYFKETWPEQFDLLEPRTAVEAGLFGDDTQHPRLMERLGDLIAIARNDAYLWWGRNDNPMLGRHGGLTPDEMLVPFMAVKW